jgi:hypothetical protein
MTAASPTTERWMPLGERAVCARRLLVRPSEIFLRRAR